MEKVAFLVGGKASVVPFWADSFIDAGDNRLVNDIEGLVSCLSLTWSLIAGSGDAVKRPCGECRSGVGSEELWEGADCPLAGCFKLEWLLSSVSVTQESLRAEDLR